MFDPYLGGEIERLRRAACDAFMCGPSSSAWGAGGGYEISGDYYVSTAGDSPDTRQEPVPRPDMHGTGGGLDVDTFTGNTREQFLDIQQQIDGIVDRWRSVPDPIIIGDLYGKFHDEVATRFLDRLKRAGGSYIPGEGMGSMMHKLDDIYCGLLGPGERETGQLDPNQGLPGEAGLVFKGYIQNLYNVVCACQEIVSMVDGNLESERDLWTKARVDAINTVGTIASVCEKISRGGSGGVGSVLTATSFVFGIISLAAVPEAPVIGLISLALSAVSVEGESFNLLDYAKPKDPGSISNSSRAIEVLSLLMNDGAGTVNQGVTVTEQAIFDTLSGAIAAIEEDKDRLFDPQPGPITEATPDKLGYDPYLATTIPSLMGDVADELLAAANALVDCMGLPGAVLRRDERIGIGNDGPYHKFYRLMHLLEAVLRELSGEVYAAADDFQTAMNALVQADADAQALLQQMAGRFASSDVGELDVERWEAQEPSHPGHEYYEWLARKPVIPDLHERMTGG